MKEFDYVIIGGGCAGLSLAYELEINNKLKDKTLAIIENREKYKRDKKLQSRYELLPIGSGHVVIYLTAIDIWTDNPIIGHGIKSFRIKCLTKLHLPNRICATHPHNYYLELLNDTGLLGTLFFICAIFYLIINKFFNFKYYEKNEKLLFICLLIIIIAEFFPLKSSGSFFSTTNSSFIFLILGMLNGLKKIKK